MMVKNYYLNIYFDYVIRIRIVKEKTVLLRPKTFIECNNNSIQLKGWQHSNKKITEYKHEKNILTEKYKVKIICC